ncbi:MAG: winged helix-turn-helix domain-containing protein, partial [Marinifilum sp.]|nr:winged helix-turn-helix domain-containing protein [Marinifilum sp.]
KFITRGIDVGGNAYIPKPLSITVLVSYIKRYASNKQKEEFLIVSDYKLNLITNDLLYKTKLLRKLSPSEKSALELLMRNVNEVVSKKQLTRQLWGHPLEKENTASLNNILSKLRALLKEDQSVKIDTVRGIGYRLCC